MRGSNADCEVATWHVAGLPCARRRPQQKSAVTIGGFFVQVFGSIVVVVVGPQCCDDEAGRAQFDARVRVHWWHGIFNNDMFGFQANAMSIEVGKPY
jgi:hypothetical protein